MKIRFVISALLLVIIVLASVCVYLFIKEKDNVRGEQFEIGKSFNFVVNWNDDITADTLNRILEMGKSHPITLLKTTELQKLIRFMDRNSFQVAAGKYLLNQADDFEQLMQKLYFVESK